MSSSAPLYRAHSFGYVNSGVLVQADLLAGWYRHLCIAALLSAALIHSERCTNLNALTLFYAPCHQFFVDCSRQVNAMLLVW